MGISTGGNINISGAGNVVDLNVTGPAVFNADIYVGGNIYNANLTSGKDGLYTGNFTVPTSSLTLTAGANPYGGSNTVAIPDNYTKLLLVP